MSRVGVCFGGPSPEHDISILTGLQAAHALTEAGRDTIALYWSPNGAWHEVPADLEASAFAEGVPRAAVGVELVPRTGGGFVRSGRRAKPLDVEVVVNCCHGGPGEDGGLQSLFDLAGLRYTGPGQHSAAISMDKLAFSGAVGAAGLPTLPLWLANDELLTSTEARQLADGPLIVKPRYGGSSIGIEIASDLETAVALANTSPLLRDGAVVQRYLTDVIDLNLSARTWPKLRLSAVERPIRSDNRAIYSYADKYLTGSGGMATAARELPANLPEAIETSLRGAARSVCQITESRSVVRIDFLWDGGDGLWVNEINPIPGSLSWYFWSHEGDSLIALLDDLIAEALDGRTRSFVTQGADGTALRSVGTIAAKLG